MVAALSVVVCVAGIPFAVILLLLLRLRARRPPVDLKRRPLTCTIVVLGDFGRSPRMQQHALSLANAGVSVVVVAHGGSAPHQRVREHALIAMSEIEPFDVPAHVPALAALPLKAVAQAATLLRALGMRAPRSDLVLVQNPPAIPTLAVALIVCALRGSRLAVDWHNFGYTVLRVSMLARRGLPATAPLGRGARALVRVAEAYERLCCLFASEHLCVSVAMAEELRARWHVRATVLHDRPPAAFAPLDVENRHALLCRLQRFSGAPADGGVGEAGGGGLLDSLHPPLPPDLAGMPEADRSFATELRGSPARAALRPRRPALVVTGTSWGADEDYSVLLQALRMYDELPPRAGGGERARLVVLVTGKGPLRAQFEAEVRRMHFEKVHIGTVWLAADDYPRLLACADLGVCLHASTSELDLPMKVVDLFGAGVPVCALEYGCIGELVREGQTGRLFSTAEGLAALLESLLAGFPEATDALAVMRARVAEWRALGWEEQWTSVAAPVLLGGGHHEWQHDHHHGS